MTEKLDSQLVARQVSAALSEDVGPGDVTAALVPAQQQVRAHIVAREPAVLCGTRWVTETFRQLDPAIHLDWQAADGERIAADQVLLEIAGAARPILTGERTALNFLQTLSGTATTTAHYVEALRGTRTRLLDTRKTIPGLRLAQKYAVRIGGGCNHRIGLFDAVMLKENHIRAAGSIAAAADAARARFPALPLIIEVETLDELAQALETGCTRILVDDFALADLREAVRIAAGRIPLEV
ncbi:MAG TPA: carboxylating nicotinate-nucleotide diphosphorylase, partial [Xanthobacteraceae bacterium]|nr:carboxylating nicotinate-nucleotide diphosphorylase [Xanthobacteraceae bacterium]